MMPIIVLMVVCLMLFGIIGSAITNVANGGVVNYDEITFEEYADEQYAKAFGSSSVYESNLLIVFLTNEEADGYYCIAWVGDNIHADINAMFGDETTEFGRAIIGSVNSEYYGYSLDSNLASVMETMAQKIEALGLESSFKPGKTYDASQKSYVVNETDLSLTAETVNDALTAFTEQTQIPVVIVVDTMENVFGKTLPWSDIFIVFVLLVIAIVAIYQIVRAVRNRKQYGDGNGDNNPNGGNGGYISGSGNNGYGNNSGW